MRHRLITPLLLVLCMTLAPPLFAQHTAAEDSAKWKLDKIDFDSIKRDNSAPQYSKRAQARLRLRDSLYSLPPSGPIVYSVEIHGTSASLVKGTTMQLSTTVKDAQGNLLSTPVTWSTNSTNVATVSASGLLTGISVGTVVVNAKSQTISTSRSFTVTSPPTPPPSDPGSVTILPGQSIQSAVDANPAGTTFILKTGTHTLQSVIPKQGDVFRGEIGTVMDGQNTTQFAFKGYNGSSWINDVTLKNIKIIRYNPPAQNGAVWGGDDLTNATERWILDSLNIRFSSNIGVRIGNHMQVLRSTLDSNGTMGIGGNGIGVIVDGIESAYNNSGCVNNPGFESGGSKFVKTDSLIVRNSRFSNNCGVGLWLDIRNQNYNLYNNAVVNNVREGIAIEVSFGGKVHDNLVQNNGWAQDSFRPNGWLWDAGIGIHASDSVEVYGNTVTENFNGIVIIQQPRCQACNPPESYAPPGIGFVARDNYIHDNIVSQTVFGGPNGGDGSVAGGAAQDAGSDSVFYRNNRWQNNTYTLGSNPGPFAWLNGYRTLTAWHGYGQDTTASPPSTTPPIVIFSHPFAPPSNGAAFAELPRDTVPVGVPTVLRTINVISLQVAYDTAKTGDLLKLPSGTTFISPTFAPRDATRTGWVTIQGTDSTSVISQTSGGSVSAVNIAPGAHHIYFLGPLTITTTTSATNAMYRSYNGETSNSQVAHHIVANGVKWWVPDSIEVRRCAWPDGAYMAIVNSQMYGCASKSGDAQAILVGNGPGPYRFENNYLEGGHQCFMSGGFDPTIPNNIPSDIVFRYNTCVKPAKWHFSGTPPNQTYTQRTQRQVKTIAEAKNMRRALFEYNRFINVYSDAQAGFCFLWKSTNQGGFAPWSQTVDATARYNRCETIASGANLAAHPQGGVAMTRVSMYGNYFKNLSTKGGEGICLQILDDVVDMIIRNNTFTNCTNNAISLDGVSGVRTTVINNVIPTGAYGVKGNSTQTGTPSIQKWITNNGGLWSGNVIVGGDCSQYPAGTTCALPAPTGVGADTTLVPSTYPIP